MRVEWDEDKNRANRRKHGISFEDARELLSSGGDCLEIFDEAHSVIEERFIAIGPTRSGLLAVVWCERDDDVRRIIGARPATQREQRLYRSYMEGTR